MKLQITSVRVERKEDKLPGTFGIIAKAMVVNPATGEVQTIHSTGSWGVESDSEKLSEAERKELASLKHKLLALGLGDRGIDYATKRAITV